MNVSKLGSIEAICFILIVIVNNIVLNVPKNILTLCGTSSILNVIYISIIVFIFLYLIFKFLKPFENFDIIDVSNFLGGKKLKVITGFLFICLFTFLISTALRSFCEMLKLTYFKQLPTAFFVICFLVVAIIANKSGLNSVTRSNLIIVPISLLTLIIIYACIFPLFTIEKILPILGNGINETFFSGATNIFAFSGISYIYFLSPILKDSKDLSKIGYIGIGISSIYLLLCIASLVLSLPSVLVIDELSPMYRIIRAAEFGEFFQRPGAIFFFVWILSIMSYLSINLLLITRIFKKITNIKDSKAVVYSFASIIFFVTMLPENISNLRFFENYIEKYLIIAITFVFSFIILVFANIKYKHKNMSHIKEEQITNE